MIGTIVAYRIVSLLRDGMKHLDHTKHVVDILEHVLEGVHIEEHQLLAQEQSHPVDGMVWAQNI
jgi:hypothetical protein